MMRYVLMLRYVLLVALAGCAEAIWVPTQNATAQLPESGLPAAVYPMPPGAPPGSVQIGTLGVQKIKQPVERKELVIRMLVTNNSDEAFRVDVRTQKLLFQNGQEMTPELAYASRQSQQPVIEVPARDRVSIDLLYAVPDSKLGHFELSWNVQTPRQVISNRTDFRKQYLEPLYYADYYYAPPPYYWGSPFFAWGWGGYNFPFYGYGYGYGQPGVKIEPGHHRSFGRTMTPVHPRNAPLQPPRTGTKPEEQQQPEQEQQQ
jgi:hypothetical protein